MNCLGVDIGKMYCQVCEISASGEIWETRVRTQRDRLEATFRGRPQARMLLESGTEAEWIARVLEELGHEVIVADPNYAPMCSYRTRRIKTDRRDITAGRRMKFVGWRLAPGPTTGAHTILDLYHATGMRHSRCRASARFTSSPRR